MPKQKLNEKTCLSAKAATGWGTAIRVDDLDHIMLQFSAEGTANLTVKFAISTADEAPDFTASQSSTNHWDYVAVYDTEDWVQIDGDTGHAVTADDFRNFLVNTDAASWINCQVSARSAGNATVKVVGYRYNG